MWTMDVTFLSFYFLVKADTLAKISRSAVPHT